MKKTSSSTKSDRLRHGPVGRTLIDLALPLVAGFAAVILFGLVDTFYVGRLGTQQLAAMSFTFPVAFFVMSIAMGLGTGVTSAIARAIGQGDRDRVCRLTTDGLFLANTIVVACALGGLMTMKPLFGAMGASADLIPLVSSYMKPWYWGVGLLVIPMVGNAAIRATGDTKSPSLIMVIAGVVNIVLDPFLIFGIGPFPRLELQGAAIATVVSWSVTFAAALWILGRRERMLDLRKPQPSQVVRSWREILYVGFPAAGTNVMIPVSAGILTRMVAGFGPDAVAAFGVGTRLQSVAIIGVSALAVAVTPFVGQNYGARDHGRVRSALRFTLGASFAYGAVVAGLLVLLAPLLARTFTREPDVARVIRQFLYAIPLSYGLYGITLVTSSVFNAMNKPLRSTLIIILRLFGLTIPLAYVGSRVGAVLGLFVGVSGANLLSGVISALIVRHSVAVEAAAVARDSYAPGRGAAVASGDAE